MPCCCARIVWIGSDSVIDVRFLCVTIWQKVYNISDVPSTTLVFDFGVLRGWTLPDGTESLVNPLEVTVDVPSADAAGSIALTTSATKPGLTYTLREGTTLDGMTDGASKLGDGSPWTPEVKVKGGASGFYSIKVTK